ALVERKTGTHIFLSYTRADLAVAAQVRRALEAAGHRVWQDVTAIKGGTEWIQSIEDGIERAYAVVTVVSSASQASEWVTIEYLHARRRHKQIVPIKIDGCDIPTMLLALNVIHAHPDLDLGVQQVLDTLPAPDAKHPPADEPGTEPQDRRQQELAYLDRVLLEHSVWQTVYTPMAGVARIRQQPEKKAIKRAATTIQPLFAPLEQRIADAFVEAPPLKEELFEDITEAVRKVRQLVILGDPGAGKTTTLWKLAADYAEAAKADEDAPLPVLLRLGSLAPAVSVRQQLQAQLGPLPLDALLAEERLALLIDALNELPALQRDEKVAEIRELVQAAQKNQTVAVVTCRELDYEGKLDLHIQEQVTIRPLDPVRIRQFCRNHLPEDGEGLFRELTSGGDVRHAWQDRRSLVRLAQNPYMLFMMTEVYAQTGSLPPNRGKLFDLFVTYLLHEREKLSKVVSAELRQRLADMAYMMQDEARGTAIGRDLALMYLSEVQLYHAVSANLLDGSDNMRFTHQLLQEYFAAQKLNQEMLAGKPASRFWPPERWWEPQGWEETAVLLAGLYSDDTTPVIKWLQRANPELAARCVLESGAHTPEATLKALRPFLLSHLTKLKRDPIKVRVAVGRALGRIMLNDSKPLDNRKGAGIAVRSGLKLPDIDWVLIPDGVFIYQKGETQTLSAFEIARYPITYVQFQCFVDAPDLNDERWWEGMPEKQNVYGRTYCTREISVQRFKFSNHPRDSVSWYQALAFCRWLSDKLGCEVTLPTEQQWERAARGTDGRLYPYGADFDMTKGNTSETGIGGTCAVGIVADGASPDGILDMNGNVFEWCLNKYRQPNQIEIDISGDRRVLRGGSWFYDEWLARTIYRFGPYPSDCYYTNGFRLVRPPKAK
ncbi:MAG: SUMF1/EgtB/PvdO family nonheme iron enzyme, partial [Anaerolineae bacterium]|nr:SUMF1/EgtB/PvdO family nonheme iron enzyme [Anaerolineae bacterium]